MTIDVTSQELAAIVAGLSLLKFQLQQPGRAPTGMVLSTVSLFQTAGNKLDPATLEQVQELTLRLIRPLDQNTQRRTA